MRMIWRIFVSLVVIALPLVLCDTGIPGGAGMKQSGNIKVSYNRGAWPVYCADARHTCRSPYKGLTEAPQKPRWTFASPGGHGISSPVAVSDDGTLYFGTWKNKQFASDKMKGHSGLLVSLSPDGKLNWIHDSQRGSPLASGVESSPLLTSDGKIIYGKDDGHVYALNRKGELLWDFACDDPFDPGKPFDDNEQVIPSPVLGKDGTVYICSHWGNVYNPTVMKELSKRAPAIKKFGIKAVKEPLWSKVYAIDVRNGSRKWMYDPSRDAPFNKKVIWGSPALGEDETIYFGAYDGDTFQGYLYALNPDGTKKWRFPKNNEESIDALQSSPSIGDDGTIYIGSFGGKKKARLYAVNPNGTLKWTYEIAENRITSTPAIGADGTIYVCSHNWGFLFSPRMPKEGHVYALEDLGEKPRLKWKFAVDYGILAPPAVDSDGNIFVASYSDPAMRGIFKTHHLYALSRKGEKLWSYPLKGSVYSPPVIDKDGTVYVGTMEHDAALYAFGPRKK
ncbi:MAG: PQQ-binding-like beta-propeller repeat protein [Nitrospirota bacterium]